MGNPGKFSWPTGSNLFFQKDRTVSFEPNLSQKYNVFVIFLFVPSLGDTQLN
ncbi:hypothetical protein LEP1GSC059_3601 [Leptospira noguchii serovar Panama str. CZ214]|uniref:Uncharacterized protein n=1 Tax=Leptospira noguchii serovar Panama str. CZ214 TaxID=1001595 RepID=T0FKY5_9LEPT|nr:hypothetical protein LEP1GSC059_3601 [Leptospira noguchii serovar Panama str. CZ214]